MKGIDHIGIAVFSIEERLPFYTDQLKFQHIKTEMVESEQVKVAFLDAINCKIELLEPISESSAIYQFLQKKGEGIHHIAFETGNIVEKIQDLESQEIRMINSVPKTGAGGAEIAFIHPKSAGGVLIELCEKKK